MTLRHPNILPLLGVTISENRLVMVSEWMEKGNIEEFVNANPNVDRLEIVCFFFRDHCLCLSLMMTQLP